MILKNDLVLTRIYLPRSRIRTFRRLILVKIRIKIVKVGIDCTHYLLPMCYECYEVLFCILGDEFWAHILDFVT